MPEPATIDSGTTVTLMSSAPGTLPRPVRFACPIPVAWALRPVPRRHEQSVDWVTRTGRERAVRSTRPSRCQVSTGSVESGLPVQDHARDEEYP